ncbi:hypothetical protein LPJ66_003389, partial [Kickxella alabastrina]
MASLLSGIRLNSQSPTAQASAPSYSAGHWTTFTDPRLFEPLPLSDSLDDALQTLVSSDQRPRRQAPQRSDFKPQVHSYESLNQYVSSKQWRALALASQASIEALSLDHTINRGASGGVLKYWVYRILALAQLGQGGIVGVEVGRLERVESGGMRRWPFELRLLRAQAPGMLGEWAVVCDRLSSLLRGCQRALLPPAPPAPSAPSAPSASSDDSRALWEHRVRRISLLLVGCAMRMGDPGLATGILEAVAGWGLQSAGADPRLLSAVARVHLQLGSVPEAERLFLQVERQVPGDRMVHMNRALFSVAMGKWESARDSFAAVVDGRPEEAVAAANNLALCQLYLGSPQLMLQSLQQLMVAAPTAAGTAEELVFNYCSGLDLQYDGARLRDAKIKKIVDVATWAGDAFDMG